MSEAERVIAGRYRLLTPLGEGGMGTVWRARDEVLGREVAVKEVRAPAGLPASEVERLYARLEREAWAAARIPHRNVVTVYDVASEGGRPWIVMELVRGLSLSDVLDAEGPMPPERAAHIGAEVLAALRAAHGAGVLHRDVKPGNVLIANDGRVVLTDFGIAMVEGSSALTMTGEVVGSPEFLAPERALGQRPGPASDLWSLGVLLYAAVEGSSPFRQDTPLSTLRAVVDEELPPPRNAGPLAPVIQGLLRKDPAERMSADAAERDLRLVASGAPPRTETAFPYAPTVVSGQEPAAPTPPAPLPVATYDTTATGPGAARSRRTVLVLIAGVVALALALGGLAYALINRDDDGGHASGSGGGGTSGGNNTSGGSNGGSGGGGSNGSTGGSGGASNSGSANGGGGTNGGNNGNGGNGNGGNGGGSTPAQSVKVHVSGANTQYKGPCPPTSGQAPAFSATFTVGRIPVSVEYRWVTGSGESSDPGWKTLAFSTGTGKTRQVNHVETAYDQVAGTYANTVAVEVRSPVRTTSNSVPYTVTCAKETPTGGASSSSPYSYSPSAYDRPVGIRQRR